ncbi:MAG TPA: GrpB family protein [Naasia sp.]
MHDGDGGVVGRERFTARPDLPRHHLFLVVLGEGEHLRMTRFRDLLRASPEARTEYGLLKRRLAPLLLVDRDVYTDGKTEFIRRLLGE